MFANSHTSLGSPVTRRKFIEIGKMAAGLLLAGGILEACGGSAASSPTASAKPAGSSGSNGGASPAASARPASNPVGAAAAQLTPVSNPAKVPATWDEMLAAAKSEGKVVVTGAPDPETRQQIPAAFQKAYGIEVEYLPGATEVTNRLQAERAAGQYTLDVEVNGSDSIYGTLLANGWLDPLKPALLLPEVADGSKWKAGKPWFRDPHEDTTLQIFGTLSQTATFNTEFVKSSDVPTADALLDPKFKGKICAFDPGANGPGLAVGAALYVAKGPDWVTKLFKDQGTVITRDYTQLADWIGHGSYPIALAVGRNYLDNFIKSGINFEFPQFPDAPDAQGGGFGVVGVLNRAPHPNAARVFANWIASKDGLSIYSKTQLQAPARSDIDATWIPSYLIPQSGVKYLDTYEYNFETGQRLDIRDFYTKLLR